MIRIEHNVETGEIKEIELTAEEIIEFEQEYAKSQLSELAQIEIQTIKAAQRAALLERLGITEEEASLLLENNG